MFREQLVEYEKNQVNISKEHVWIHSFTANYISCQLHEIILWEITGFTALLH